MFLLKFMAKFELFCGTFDYYKLFCIFLIQINLSLFRKKTTI
jgi:hypothetical protein